MSTHRTRESEYWSKDYQARIGSAASDRGVKNAVSLARRPGTRWFSAGYRSDRGQPRYVKILSRIFRMLANVYVQHRPHRRGETYRILAGTFKIKCSCGTNLRN